MPMVGKSSSRWLLVKLMKDSDSCGCSTDTQARDTHRQCVVVGNRSTLRHLLDHGDQAQFSSSTPSTKMGDSKKVCKEHPMKICEGKDFMKKSSKKICKDNFKASENNLEECLLIEDLSHDNHVWQDNVGVSEPIHMSKRPVSSDVQMPTNRKSAPAVLVSQAWHCRHQKPCPAVTQV
ncbi:hypothetical protein PR048_015459 [Dryococelus australis]|uniref:Uncharacterized protein n=1 Tax=Dryococelus australis TaxID=614101 RepID=A0ABQ9HHB0_9NEOP|nr:hypothetical protein PR048_015459 [Dryococelus australis]